MIGYLCCQKSGARRSCVQLYSMIAMSFHNVPIVEVEGFRPCDYYYDCSDCNASSSSTATYANGKCWTQEDNKTIIQQERLLLLLVISLVNYITM